MGMDKIRFESLTDKITWNSINFDEKTCQRDVGSTKKFRQIE